MTLLQLLGNVGWIFAVMGALALLELAFPLLARGESARARLPANLGLTVLTLLLNAGLISLAAVLGRDLGLESRGLLSRSSLSGPALLAVGVGTLDLATYAAHRFMHARPGLWRIHRVHHSDSFVDVTTTLRQHPLEGLWRFVWIAIPTWVLGLPAAVVVTYRLLSVSNGLLEHANLRLSIDRALSWVWVTPNLHKIHHARARRLHDTNYGNLSSVFDRLFGSFTPASRGPGEYGLEGCAATEARSLPALLRLGVRSAGDGRAVGAADLGRSE